MQNSKIINDIAKVLNTALNYPNMDTLTWLGLCHDMESKFRHTGHKIDRIEFLTACGFDEAVGHYDWRAELTY